MSDGFQHTNRSGEVYYLQSKRGSNGKLKFSFTRKLTGTVVKCLPDGYEVRELPETAQVMIRRIKPVAILPEEKKLLEEAIRRHTDGLLFIVDAEEKSLVVYTSDMNVDASIGALRLFAPMNAEHASQMKEYMLGHAAYSKMMRFTLVNARTRQFSMDRWCFKGSIDDWFYIEGDQPLSVLAEKYVRHLGQESFSS